MRKIFSIAAVMLAVLITGTASAQMDVQEIVAKASNTAYYAGNDGRSSVT